LGAFTLFFVELSLNFGGKEDQKIVW
jgi:hypothetical protein